MIGTLSTRVVAVSEPVAEAFVESLGSDKVDIVYNGVDLGEFDRALRANTGALRATLGDARGTIGRYRSAPV